MLNLTQLNVESSITTYLVLSRRLRVGAVCGEEEDVVGERLVLVGLGYYGENKQTAEM